MFRKHRFHLTTRLHPLVYGLLRLYSLTLRLRVENEAPWLAHLRGGGRVLLCTWHQQFFSAIGHFRTYAPFRPSLMISQSQDGDIIARIAARQGWHVVRGSSSKDGGKALHEMIARLDESGLAGHIVDGPRGPAGVVKAGVIRLARATGAHIVPFSTAADRAWYFKSWDRFMLPKPFARVTLRFGPLLPVPADGDEGVFESQRKALEDLMRPALLPPASP